MTKAKPALLTIGAVGTDLRNALAIDHELVDHVLEGPAAKLIETIPAGHTAVLTRALYGVPIAVMDALPELKLVVSLGAGLEKIDLAEAARRGIKVAHTPNELTEDVADYAIGLMYASLRRILAADAHVRQDRWKEGSFPITRRVCDKKVGIIGLGKIGARVAEKCAALGLGVNYHDRAPRSDVVHRFFPDARSLAEASDVLVLTCAGTPETHHIVDGAVLDALGSDGILINLSRGSVVDESALITRLESRAIHAAALDVFENEPAPDARFKALDNVILSPHAASLTRETRLALIDRLVCSTKAFFANEPFPDAAAAFSG